MRASALFTFLILVLVAMTGCNPSVHTHIVNRQQPPLEENQEVAVITKEQSPPAGAEFLGVVSIDESVFTTNCSYDYVLYLAKKEAREAGANLIQITQHRTPDFWSSCHRIEANLYAVIKRFPGAEDEVGYWNEGPPDEDDATRSGTPTDSVPVAQGPSPYFNQDQLKAASGQEESSTSHYESIRLSAIGGFSRRLSPFPDGLPQPLQEYLNSLRNGLTVGADIGFHIGGGSYLGPQYLRFRSSNSMIVTFDAPDNVTGSGEMRETITIQFIGVQWTNRYLLPRSESSLYLSTAIGYTSIHDSGIYPFEIEPDKYALLPYTMTGNNFGLRLEGGADIKLSPKMSLALGLGFSTGTIYKLQLDVAGSTSTIELDRDEGEGLLRMDILTGLRWHF